MNELLAKEVRAEIDKALSDNTLTLAEITALPYSPGLIGGILAEMVYQGVVTKNDDGSYTKVTK